MSPSKILLSLLLSVSCVGQALTFNDGAQIGALNLAASTCATSDSTLPKDVMIEGFNGTGYELGSSWSEFGTTANVDENGDSSGLSTGKPTGACSEALKVTIPNDGTETGASYNGTFSLSSDLDIRFYVYIPSANIPADGSVFRCAVANNSSTPSSFQRARVLLQRSGSNMQLSAQGTTTSTAITVSQDEWHLVKLHLDSDTASSYIQVDGGTEESFNRYTGTTMSHIHVGGCEGVEAGETCVVWWDLVTADVP